MSFNSAFHDKVPGDEHPGLTLSWLQFWYIERR